jgi:hypothetical protein
MHIALLTALIVAGAGQPANGPTDQPITAVSESAAPGECAACQGGGCENGECAQGKAPKNHPLGKWLVDWFGPMPQTCYQPRYGCYPGNSRDINRYPAFHGYYYRAPYNYRHYFDYPWHAQPHEPEGYSYRGIPDAPVAPGPGPGLTPTPAPAMPPAPAPAPDSVSTMKSASYEQPKLLQP